MKLILFGFGLWFIYWNCRELSENSFTVWQFIALLATVIFMGLWVLRSVINRLVAASL